MLDPDNVLDHTQFTEHERYLFICSSQKEIKRLYVVWTKITLERRRDRPVSSIAAQLLIVASPDSSDEFVHAAKQMCRILGWEDRETSERLDLEDALLILYKDVKISFWEIARHWFTRTSLLSRTGAVHSYVEQTASSEVEVQYPQRAYLS